MSWTRSVLQTASHVIRGSQGNTSRWSAKLILCSGYSADLGFLGKIHLKYNIRFL